MFKTTMLSGAGVTLALALSATPAFAQMVPGSAPHAAAQEDPVQRNLRIAQEHNLPPDLLTSENDRWGRPQTRTIEQSIAELGVDGARMRALDDFDWCNDLIAIDELYAQIRAADLEVVQATEEVQRARTRAERRQAEARLGRAQNNLFQLLGTVVRLGLAASIPGVGWAYGGYILVSEVTQWSGRRQHNRELDATDALNDYFMVSMQRQELLIRAWTLRMEQHDRRGRLWDGSMRRWCDAMRPYHVRMAPVSATYTPAPSSH